MIELKSYCDSSKTEVSPNEVMMSMSKNCFVPIPLSTPSPNDYQSVRQELVRALRDLSKHLSYCPSTFFLSVCYMDVVCSKPEHESFDYLMMATCCLWIAAKFNENSMRTQLGDLFGAMAKVTEGNFYFTIEDLIIGELLALKILEYKLNYFTIHHFIIFFFTHGAVLEEQFRALHNDKQMSQLIGKIYAQALTMIDVVLEDYDIMLGLRCDLIAIVLMKKSIYNVLSMIPSIQSEEMDGYLNDINRLFLNVHSGDSEEIEHFQKIEQNFGEIQGSSLIEVLQI